MKKASVSETKNHLSAILREVREGETYLIVDHGKPVARIEPIAKRSEDADRAPGRSRAAGHSPPRTRAHSRGDPAESPPRLPKDVSAVAVLLDEREGGR